MLVVTDNILDDHFFWNVILIFLTRFKFLLAALIALWV